MNNFQIGLVIAVIAIFVVFSLRRSDTPTFKVGPNTIQLGQIRHAKLPEDLIKRIRAFESAFTDVYPISHEQWVDGFKRDAYPENEIVVWEHIAQGFTQFVAGRDLSLDARREAFSILLVRSSGTDEAAIYSGLKHLTLDNAKKLTSLYTAPPKPIQYERR